jgi:hypothetical protein
MKVFNRKSPIRRLGDNIKDSLDPRGTHSSLSGLGSVGKALKDALPNKGKNLKAALPDKDKALKAGLAAGGLTALTAASAGISSLRRRQQKGARDDS